MDEELLELQRQFEFAQQAKSSVRLSERNVVELVQKLQQLGIIDFDLLHTTSGKEYITPDELRSEIVSEVEKRGRVSLIDLAEATGVDLYHVEKQSERIVSSDSALVLINGEIISNAYWDTVCEDINDRLQECSQISLAEIAAQLQVGSEMVLSVIEPRLGTLVKGRLEGGQLYTPAYIARLTAMVRGAARGVAVPTNLSVLWSSLQLLLQDTDVFKGVAIESSFFQTLFNGLLKGGEILGSLRGAHWTPMVFAIAQIECVDSFFSQNSFISYETLHNLGIPKPVQFLQSRYPDAQPLTTVFAHGSLIEMVGAAVEEAIERGSWINSLALLPSSFSSQDAYKILSLSPLVQRALKSSEARLLGESYVFSEKFVKELHASIDKQLESMDFSGSAATGSSEDSHFITEAKPGHNDKNDQARLVDNESVISASASDKGSKKKKGKPENFKSPVVENPMGIQDVAPKSKKNQKKGKASLAGQASDAKLTSKRDTDRLEMPNYLSEESIVDRLRPLVPDLEEQGIEDTEIVLASLSNYLRPLLINSWNQRKKSAFSENSQKVKQALDDLQRRIDEEFLNIQFYEKVLDIFEDDVPTSILLHKHLLRTTATSIVDALLSNLDLHNQLTSGILRAEPRNSTESMSHSDRISLAKVLPEPLSVRATKLVETLDGKRVDLFMTAVRELAEKSGINLKKLDKKMERILLHSYRKDLTSQVSSETDPISLLPKVVSLLYVQIHGGALQAPGRAISAAISHLRDKLDSSAFKVLSDYHSCTVKLLSLVSAGTGQDDDRSMDAISMDKERLESCMPALKSLVIGSNS